MIPPLKWVECTTTAEKPKTTESLSNNKNVFVEDLYINTKHCDKIIIISMV